MTFLKNILSSSLGTALAFFWIFIIFLIMTAVVVSSSGSDLNEGEVLKIDLFNQLVEHTEVTSLDDLNIPFQLSPKKDGIIELVQTIDAAAKDASIKGIYVRCSSLQGGFAGIKELRDAFERFQVNGKWVCFHSNSLAENGLYLSSVGTSFVSPSGSVEFNGISSELMFFKNLLGNLGIESKIYRVGKFKSAVEPFIVDQMSPESRVQLEALQEGLYSSILKDISDSRNIETSTLRELSDKMTIRTLDAAVDHGLIDGIKYEDEAFDYMQTLLETSMDVKFKDWRNYHQLLNTPESDNKVAVLVAEGEIISGTDDGDEKKIGSSSLIKQIRELRDDNQVKAVVLRINSPGGSALASDIIWREIALLKKKKPVIASMGDVAASGGYYIAMGCDKVVASPNTITGSIGVFGIMFNFQDFLNNKLGITFDRVQTGEFSGVPSFTRDMSEAEDEIIQSEVERIYADFLSKAAQGRSLSVSQVHKIAQGRVWSSKDALNNGLVDELGGLQTAIDLAAQSAELTDDYGIEVYPKETGFWSKLGLSSDKEVKNQIGEELGNTYNRVKSLQNLNGYQMHAPFWLKVE